MPRLIRGLTLSDRVPSSRFSVAAMSSSSRASYAVLRRWDIAATGLRCLVTRAIAAELLNELIVDAQDQKGGRPLSDEQ
jgi:hypothetical protein